MWIWNNVKLAMVFFNREPFVKQNTEFTLILTPNEQSTREKNTMKTKKKALDKWKSKMTTSE